eukprot:IDg21267t1
MLQMTTVVATAVVHASTTRKCSANRHLLRRSFMEATFNLSSDEFSQDFRI